MPLLNRARTDCAEDAWHFRSAGILLAAWVILLAVLPCFGEQAKPDVAPPAHWITPIPFDARAKVEPVDPSEEMRWLLKDRQINASNNETFYHEVRQVLTPSGVNKGSHITVNYDPGYQLLTFHWVKIWRGTNSFNRLDPDKIEVTQSGLDPNELLFSSEKSALLMLDDVRMGDIIDFAYTLQGDNPILAGRFSANVEAQGEHPIERMTTRLLWPAGRRLFVKNHGTDVKYTTVRKPGLFEFTWNFKQVPAWRSEPPLPVWYDPYSWVQLSEFQRWAEVSQLFSGFFTNTAPLSAPLNEKIAEWKRLPDPESRVLAALRFVQDEVRYLGIESGESGYRPASPSVVFDRRFGDCKDKSFLLVTILRALGVDATPELVNTTMRQTVAEMNPAATVFDHAITQINLGGQLYWLDATANYQRGPLAVRYWPTYGYGLLVRPGAKELTPIPPCPVQSKTTISQYFQLGRLDQPSRLKVVTYAEGRDADQLRADFSKTVRNELEQSYLNYYARYYPNITQTDPINYIDDEQQNRIEVDAFYSIQKIWTRLPEDTYVHCQIYPINIAWAMDAPTVSLRTMPLGVKYPNHQFFHAEVTVPSFAEVQPDNRTIETPAFYFHRFTTTTADKVILDYEYRALTDVIQPDAVPNYVQQLDAAQQVMSYTISSD